ncbi:MAG TPA: IclR family transcriptional regulator [Acidimicrobiales bacterium]|nr:IclR family transcriptional regulator [Acidimicrobiales bacterium]
MAHLGGTTGRADTTVRSVERAVSVLEILAREHEAGPTEIAVELGVHKSTVSRMLAVLERRGLAVQVRERGPYRLGSRLALLAGVSASGAPDLSRSSGPVCDWLAASAGETAGVAVLDGDEAVSVAEARGAAAVTSQHPVGRRSPLHATSTGKVLLAHLPPARRREVLMRPLARFTASTLTRAEELAVQLDVIVDRGWATAVEEWEIGLNAVAAPVRARDGGVVAALSVSGPAYRLGRDELSEASALVCKAAREVSSLLGYVSTT